MKLGIRAKLFLIIASMLLIVLGTHTYLQMTLQRTLFDNNLLQRNTLMREHLQQRAVSQAEILKHLIVDYIAAYKLFELNVTATQAVQKMDGLEKVIIVDKFNRVYVDTSKPDFSGLYIQALEVDSKSSEEQLSSLKRKLPDTYEVREVQLEDSTGLEYKIPLEIGQEVWGHLLLVYSLKELNTKIIETTKEHEYQQYELNLKVLAFTLSLLLLAYIIISNISMRLIKPIITLTNYTQDLAKGDFSRIESIPIPRNDEIGLLTHNFVDMAKKLEQNNKTLENYNQTLEQKVERRTHALNLNNEALKKALTDLEESQQQLIQSEKMVALGQLISGIAHEINTPLGAIQASAGNNSKSFRNIDQTLPDYLSKATQADKELLTLLLQKFIVKTKQGVISSTREERQQKKKIQQYLESLNIKRARAFTELLLDMVNFEDLKELAPLLNYDNALNIITLAHDLSALERNNQTILTAVSKASKVVFSLKNFSHHNVTGDKILSNINFGIQTVLVLYQNAFKQGCTVIKNYGDLPEILCYPDELNQVWTNIIHNALHAMQNQGTITIDTQVENNNIVVRISDDGSGIPLDIQDKVFTSFFTTKPAGEGSGLGLGICKRIIDKHEGNISLDSVPGKTIFTITLPIVEPEIESEQTTHSL